MDQSQSSEPNEIQRDVDGEEEDAGVSLEELSQAYAKLLGQGDASDPADGTKEPAQEPSDQANSALEVFDPLGDDLTAADACPVTPRSILESILFVGRPDDGSISASEIAGLMRGVRESEIEALVDELNQVYEETNRAIRVVPAGSGYRVQLAEDLQFIHDRFYGRVKDVRLSQSAIDCLALVSYQPGISREKLEDQRGQPSGSVLNQLVRRQLLEMRREGEGKKLQPHYYPTDRLLQLAGLSSLDDLPQVEETE